MSRAIIRRGLPALLLTIATALALVGSASASYEDQLQPLSLTAADLPPGFVEAEDRYSYGEDPTGHAHLSRIFRQTPDGEAPTEVAAEVYSLVVRYASVFTAQQALRNPHSMLGINPAWEETQAPPIAEASRAFQSAPEVRAVSVVARQENLVFAIGLYEKDQPRLSGQYRSLLESCRAAPPAGARRYTHGRYGHHARRTGRHRTSPRPPNKQPAQRGPPHRGRSPTLSRAEP
jgi:hypothetical protein